MRISGKYRYISFFRITTPTAPESFGLAEAEVYSPVGLIITWTEWTYYHVTMGCADSIISAVVAKSNDSSKVSPRQGKDQPAPLRGDRIDRDEARERRRRLVLERHAKTRNAAQSISENAMAEKERLSSSTWRSWRSGVNGSDVISPNISISVKGSDGTASPDNLLNPAIAYAEEDEPKDKRPSPEQAHHDVNANEMQIRTMELPNQVMEEYADMPKLGLDGEDHLRASEMERAQTEDRSASEGGDLKIAEHPHTAQDANIDIRVQNPTDEEGERDGEGGEKRTNEKMNEEEEVGSKVKRKHGKHRKAVKFVTDIATDSSDNGRKATSQGR